MPDDEFNELVKHKFAEFERKNGRVPTLQELADTLGIDSRMLARKLRKAIKTLGVDTYTEGTSAFKSTLRELLSGDILTRGTPGFADLSVLLHDVMTANLPYAELRWTSEQTEYRLYASRHTREAFLWVLLSSKSGRLFERITKDLGDICGLLQAVLADEEVDSRLISHVSGKPSLVEIREIPVVEYQDPIPEDQLPPNVLPFRKAYQHLDE